jgi:hypothetical protein
MLAREQVATLGITAQCLIVARGTRDTGASTRPLGWGRSGGRQDDARFERDGATRIKYWRLAYRWDGKQRTLALGVYPAVGLMEAMQRATMPSVNRRGVRRRSASQAIDLPSDGGVNLGRLFTPIPAALAAKTATATVPIVFAIGSDPVGSGLVASMNRPGGNITGVSFLSVELGAKRLELVRNLVPKVATIALLVNPNNSNADEQAKEMQSAAATLGLQSNVLSAGSQNDFDAVFATLVRQREGALVVRR